MAVLLLFAVRDGFCGACCVMRPHHSKAWLGHALENPLGKLGYQYRLNLSGNSMREANNSSYKITNRSSVRRDTRAAYQLRIIAPAVAAMFESGSGVEGGRGRDATRIRTQFGPLNSSPQLLQHLQSRAPRLRIRPICGDLQVLDGSSRVPPAAQRHRQFKMRPEEVR